MKKIYFIRHAKSSWNEAGLSDFERTLNKRGKKDVPFMASRLKSFNVMPDLVLSSSAKRAKKTAQMICETIGYDKDKLSIQDCLYDSSYDIYRYLLETLDDTLTSIFIIAHNPTITEVAERLSGSILTNMPTCSIVCVEFDIESFKNIKEEGGKVLFFDYPKKHKII